MLLFSDSLLLSGRLAECIQGLDGLRQVGVPKPWIRLGHSVEDGSERAQALQMWGESLIGAWFPQELQVDLQACIRILAAVNHLEKESS